jgi:hypothetical protein
VTKTKEEILNGSAITLNRAFLSNLTHYSTRSFLTANISRSHTLSIGQTRRQLAREMPKSLIRGDLQFRTPSPEMPAIFTSLSNGS